MEMMIMKTLTLEQAFEAMFYFLEHEYEMTKSADIGGLLGSLSWEVREDRRPADPAAWQDWLDAAGRLSAHPSRSSLATEHSAPPPDPPPK